MIWFTIKLSVRGGGLLVWKMSDVALNSPPCNWTFENARVNMSALLHPYEFDASCQPNRSDISRENDAGSSAVEED